jgi:hypothetical protein
MVTVVNEAGEHGPTNCASGGRFRSDPGNGRELGWFWGMIANWLRSRGCGNEIQRAAKEAFIHECYRDKECVANLST